MSENIESIIREWEERLTTAQRQGKNRHLVDVLNDFAWELRNTDSRRSLSLSQQAGECSQSISYLPGLAVSLRNQGYFHLLLSNNQAALAKSFEALRLFEELKNESGQAATLNTIGNIYHALGDYGNALKTHLRSLKMKENIDDQKGLAQSLNNIGTVYHRLNDTARAMEYFLKSLDIDEDIGDRSGEVATLNNIGLVYQEMGEYEKALELYTRSLNTEDVGSLKHAVLLMNIGNVYYNLGDYATAKSHQEKSLRIKQQIGDRGGEAVSLLNIGELRDALQDSAGAQEDFNRGLKLARDIGDRFVEASALVNLGTLYFKQGALERSKEHLEQAMSIAGQLQSVELISRCRHLLSRVCEKEMNWEPALVHYKAFHEQREQLLKSETERRTRALMIQFEVDTALKENEIYRLKNVELVELNNDLKALTQSLQELNSEKAQLLIELKRKNEMLGEQAKVDSLTGLWNRRHVDVELENEFNRARRFSRPLTVVMADIDQFKSVNDRYSHLLGDEVLRTVSRLIRKTCRTIDVVARYGGEEFLLYLPETPADHGVIACEKIRRAVEDHPWRELDPGLQVTISLGVTDDMNVSSFEKMISAADAKLYEAKRSGRNRVCS